MKAKPKANTKTTRSKTKSASVDDAEPQRTLDALQKSEAKFSILFNHAPYAAQLANLPDGLIVEVNAAFENLIGYARDETVGKSSVELNIYPDPEIRTRMAAEFKARGFARNVETTLRAKSGDLRAVLVNSDLIEIAGEKYILTTAQDITERKQAEQHIVQMKRLYATLSQVNQTIVRVKSQEELYQSICDVALKFGELTFAWIGLLDEVTGDIRPVAVSGLNVAIDKWPFPILNIHRKPSLNSVITDAMHTSNTVTSEDVQTDERTIALRDVVQKFGFHSLAAVPFRLRGQTIGILVMISVEQGVFKAPEELKLLDEMGLDISFALDTMETEKAKRQWADAFEHCAHGIAIGLPSGKLLTCNPAFARSHGASIQEISSMPILDMYAAQDHEQIKGFIAQADREGSSRFEANKVRKDGSIYPVEMALVSVRDENGKLLYRVATQQDITERRLAEKKLEKQNQRLKVLREIDTAILSSDSVENIVGAALDHIRELIDCERANLALIDWENNEAVNFDVRDTKTSAISKGARVSLDLIQNILQVLSQNQPVLIKDLTLLPDPPPQIKIFIKEGLRSRCILPLVSQGKLIGSFTLSSKISDYFDEAKVNLGREIANQVAIAISQRRLVASLRASEEKYSIIFDRSPFALTLTKVPEVTIVSVNDAFMELFEFTRDEVIGKTSVELGITDPESRAKIGAEFQARGRVHDFEVTRYTKTGKRLDLALNLDWVTIGEEKFILTTIRDITERKQAEAQIEYQANLLKHINDAVIAVDNQFHITAWNHAAETMYGWSAEEALGNLSTNIIRSEMTAEERQETLRQLREFGMYRNEIIQYRKDGQRVHIEASTITLYDKDNKVTGLLSVNRDITERKRAEEQLRYQAYLLENVNDAIIASDAQFKLKAWNPAAEEMYGWKAEEVLGRNGVEILQTRFSEADAKEMRRQIAESGYYLGEATQLRKDGTRIPVEVASIVLRDTDGKITDYVSVNRDITERKRAEESLRIENERFQRFVESNIVGIVIANASGQIITANDYYLKLLDVTRQDFLDGKVDWKKFTPPEWLPADEKAIRELREHGVCEPYEKEYVRADGRRIPVYLADAMLPGPEEHIAAFVLDLTNLKQAENSTRLAEQQYRLLFEESPVMVVLTEYNDTNVLIAKCNQIFLATLGYDQDEVIGKSLTDFYSADSRVKLEQSYLHTLKGIPLSDERELITRDGRIVPVLLRAVPRANAEGVVIGTQASFIDITERKQAEAALYESGKRIDAIISSAMDAIISIDADQNILMLNAAAEQMFQCRASEVIGESLELFIPERFHTTHRRHIEQFGSGGTTNRTMGHLTDLRGVRADGEEFPIEASVSQVAVRGEKVFTAILRDVTERKRAEEKIQRQLEHLNSLRTIDTAISSSFDIHVTLDIVLKQVLTQLHVDAAAILLVNPQTQTIEYAASRGFRSNVLQDTQFPLTEGYAGRAVRERKTIYIPALLETEGKLAEVMRSAQEDFVDYYGTPLVSKDGIKGVLEIYHRSTLHSDPEWLVFLETLAGQAAIAIDNAQLFEGLQRANIELEQRVAQRTEELKKTNIELEHANRTKDEFLATMSHELRTPLNSILGLSETLLEQRRDPLSEFQQRYLQTIASSGNHLLELINDILDLSKIEAGRFDHHPQMVGVNDLCQSSLTFVKEVATRKSITLTYQQETPVSKMYADPRRIKQILINLLTNAVKFTPEHGRVILQVAADAEQDRIQFSVIDNGIGIAPENLSKLFQPFVQIDSRLTREYEGTGLGLALVQKLTDLHGGSVSVESAGVPGKGSRFTVNLPLGQDMPDQPPAHAADNNLLTSEQLEKSSVSISKPADRAVVLLAEDNMANILTIGDYLESHGYQVVVAHDGLDAIEKAEALPPNIILMDIQMPVLNGLEAISRLRADSRFAATPIIAITALAMPGDRERCLVAGANEYMSKPVSLKALIKTIEAMLKF